jgi:sulfur carrier protein
MQIKFNQKDMTIQENSTLQDTLSSSEYSETLFSIAINGEFIPKNKYAETRLCEGDIIEFFTAMQGG